jgi:hypothetical protein
LSVTTSCSFSTSCKRLRQHLALERLAALLHLVERVLADADVEDVLQDHGP